MGWIEKIAEPESVRGWEFADLVFRSVKMALSNWQMDRSTVVNEILMGGRFYNVPRAVYEVFGFPPVTGYVKIQSREKPGSTEGSVKFGKLVEGDRMVVGDTVASGGTMELFLKLVKPKELFLVTIGSKEGVERVKERFRGKLWVKFIPFPTKLNPVNKTDMPIDLDLLPHEWMEKLLERTTENILKVQCIIGDFSDSIANVPAFLSEWFAILSQMWAYLDWKSDERGKEIVQRRGKKLISEVLEWTNERNAREMFAEALTRRQRLKGFDRTFSPKEVELSVERMGRKLKEEEWEELLAWD